MKKQTKEQILAVIAYAAENGVGLEIVSGEGEQGTPEEYSGAITCAAIGRRLASERCGGDRWAVIQSEDGYRG